MQTTMTAADIADIDAFLAEISTPSPELEAQAAALDAAYAAEQAHREALAANAREINQMRADYFAALELGDTATCRRLDAALRVAYGQQTALIG